MSTTIDQRVVEMRFDNKHFESNVSTTMSTLDKLKAKLNFTESAKGLSNLGSATKNFNMSGLTSGIETVNAKFSALEVMGVTALANITNSAVNAGKRIAKSLTIDPIKSGFQEYELKMGSIQTIMASTGESLETVNEHLNALNEYSDRTIYSFQDMTSNIGKFTNAGVKLEDAVQAMKGISNEAAISGANANEASRAMYNFAQALSAGYVKLIDWKSIENANMATVEFKNQLIETAVEMGTVTKAADGMYTTLKGNTFNATKGFNEVFQDQWMTSEVLISTLKKYADETTDIGKKAYSAAQDVKTFTMMMDTLKESIQSGWARTWELVIGDFEQGKNLWTSVSQSLDKVVSKISDTRNNLLQNALGGSGGTGGWEKITETITKAGISVEDFQNGLIETAKKHGVAIDDMIKDEKSFVKTLKRGWLTKDIFIETLDKFTEGLDGVSKSTEDSTEQLKYFQKMFDEVWRGNWGNGADRIRDLTEAGHDYAAIQKLVNEHTAGYKLTLEDLTDEQLKSVGYTDDQIKALRELEDQAKKTGTPIEELIDSLSKPTGRELLLESFANVVEAFRKPFESIKEAWGSVFGDIDGAKVLYDLIEGFHGLTEAMIISDETAGNLKTIFEGLFTAQKITVGIMGKSVIAGIKLLSAVLGLFGTDLVGVAAKLASYITMFGNWVEEHTMFINMTDKVAKVLHAIIDGVYRCVKAFASLDIIQGTIQRVGDLFAKFFGKIGEGFDGVGVDNFVENIKSVFDKIEKWILSLNDSENIGEDFVKGIANGIKAAAKYISDAISDLFNSAIGSDNIFGKALKSIVPGFSEAIASMKEWFKGLKDSENLPEDIAKGIVNGIGKIPELIVPVFEAIRSILSAGMAKIPTDVIAGFVNGIWDKALLIGQTMIELGKIAIEKICDVLGIDSPSKVFFAIGGFIIAGLIGGLMSGSTELGETIKTIASNLGDFLKNLDWGAVMVSGFGIGAFLIAKKFLDVVDKIVSPLKSIKGMADSVSSFFKTVGSSISDYFKAAKIEKISKAIRNIAVSIAILAGSVALLSLLNPGRMWGAIGAIAALAGIIAGLTFVVGKFGPKETAELGKFSLALAGLAGALLIIALAVKLMAGVSSYDLIKAGAALFGIAAVMVGLTRATDHFNKDAVGMGGVLLKMAATMLLMVAVLKLVSGMDEGDIAKGVITIAAFTGIMAAMMAMTKLLNRKKNALDIGKMLFKMAASILVMAVVVKLISTMSPQEIVKGIAVITAFAGILVGMAAISKLFDKKGAKMGNALLGMAGAMVLMAIVVKLMVNMDVADIIKGLIAVSAFGAVVAALVYVTKYAGGKDLAKVGSTILMLAAAIGILAGVSVLLGLVKIGNLAKGLIAVGLLTGMMVMLVKSTKDASQCKDTLVGIAIAVGVMAAALVALSFIPAENLLKGVGAMAAVIGGVAALMLTATKLKDVTGLWKSILPIMAMLALVSGIVVALSLLPNTDSVLSTAIAIGVLMSAMSASMFIISKTGKVSMSAIGSLAAMGLVVAELSAILGIMSYLGVEASIQTAGSISTLLLTMSAAMVIASLAGPKALAGVGALTAMGLVVGELAIILGLMSKFDVAPSIETAGSLSVLLLAMSGALVILGAVGAMGPAAFVGIGALAAFIAGIGGLIVAIGALITEFPKLEEFLNNGIPVLEKIGYALGSFFGNIIGGFLGNITSGLPDIASDLSAFMTNLSGFIEGAKNIDANTMAGVQMLAEALLTLTATSVIDSLTSWFTGGSSLGDFASDIKTFITNLSGIGTFSEAQAETLKNAAAAIGPMAEAAKSIPNEGGWSAAIFGDNSLSQFAEGIKNFVSNLSDMGTFTEDQVNTVKRASDAVATMSKAAKNVDGQAGWSKKLFGDNSIASFANEIKNFVSNISGIGTFSDDQLTSVKNAAKAISEVSKVAKNIDGQAGWSKKLFGDNSLTAFAEDLKGFVSTLSELDTTVIDNFGESLIRLGECSIEKFIEGFNNAETNVQNGAEKIVKKAISSIKAKYSDFKGAGKYVVEGFAKGISSNTYLAEAQARAMAKAAADAAQAQLDINSPSRVFKAIGSSIPEGFAMGIDTLGNLVRAATSNMGQTAIDGVNRAVSNIASIVNSDIDAQPTIRPVLDLAGVESGIGVMNSMFGNQSVGVLANVNGISTMMNSRSQNGTNTDIISAIDKFRDDFKHSDRATYQINGITYDDGSNLRDAIETIIRFANIERRV